MRISGLAGDEGGPPIIPGVIDHAVIALNSSSGVAAPGGPQTAISQAARAIAAAPRLRASRKPGSRRIFWN